MSEERNAAVLRMLEAELPPSTVDMDRAVRAGRRRERVRRGLVAGAVAGVVMVVGGGFVAVQRTSAPPPVGPAAGSASATSAPPSERACVATPLPGAGATAREISPNGRIAVGVIGDPEVPVAWTDGQLTPLTVPAGVSAEPHAVNDDGVVVGVANRSGRTAPFVVRGGVYSELPMPSGSEGAAHGVNTRGDVVGEVWSPDGDSKAVLWRPSGERVTLASTTKWASAHAIADDGAVFGSLNDGDTPYMWAPDGAGRPMPTPPGSVNGKVFGVAGDYAYGHAGTAPAAGTPAATAGGDRKQGEVAGAGPRWVRWQLSTGAVVEVTVLTPTGVDANGVVVGFVRHDDHFAPARWRDGRVTRLPGLSGEATGTEMATSRDGTRLVGGGTSWTC